MKPPASESIPFFRSSWKSNSKFQKESKFQYQHKNSLLASCPFLSVSSSAETSSSAFMNFWNISEKSAKIGLSWQACEVGVSSACHQLAGCPYCLHTSPSSSPGMGAETYSGSKSSWLAYVRTLDQVHTPRLKGTPAQTRTWIQKPALKLLVWLYEPPWQGKQVNHHTSMSNNAFTRIISSTWLFHTYRCELNSVYTLAGGKPLKLQDNHSFFQVRHKMKHVG